MIGKENTSNHTLILNKLAGSRNERDFPAVDRQNEDKATSDDGHILQGILEVFEEVLGVNPVKEDDDFFHLGGHSLLAIRVVGKLFSKLEVKVSVRSLFDHSTPIELAAHIRQMHK